MAVDVEGSVSQVETPTETAPETAPTETPVEKAPFEPPSWIYEAPKEEAPQEALKPKEPDRPRQEWTPPVFDPDLFARDGNQYMQWYQRAWMGPVAQAQLEQEQRFKELQDRVASPTIHPAIVNEQMRRAQTGLVKALEKFEADEAFASPRLRKSVEEFYKNYLKEARTLAKKGDFSGISALADDEDFHVMNFGYLKSKAGFRGGKVPTSVASPEVSLETPKGHAVAGDAKFSAEDEAAFKYAHETRGISRADFAKLIKIDAEQRGE